MNSQQQSSTPIYDKRPVMFGANPIGFILLWLFIPLGIWGLQTLATLANVGGYRVVNVLSIFAPTVFFLLMLLSWWLRSIASRLTIESNYVVLRTGLLSKNIREIAVEKIRTVEVHQTPLQRLTSVGRVRIYGTGDKPEIVLGGLPRPDIIKTALTSKGR